MQYQLMQMQQMPSHQHAQLANLNQHPMQQMHQGAMPMNLQAMQ